MPAFNDLYDDQRVDEGLAAAMLYQAGMRIPLGTAVLEEIAFRAVLPALLAVRIGLRARLHRRLGVLRSVARAPRRCTLNERQPVGQQTCSATGVGGITAAVVIRRGRDDGRRPVLVLDPLPVTQHAVDDARARRDELDRLRDRLGRRSLTLHGSLTPARTTLVHRVTPARRRASVSGRPRSLTRPYGSADRDVRQRLRRAHRRPGADRPAARRGRRLHRRHRSLPVRAASAGRGAPGSPASWPGAWSRSTTPRRSSSPATPRRPRRSTSCATSCRCR